MRSSFSPEAIAALVASVWLFGLSSAASADAPARSLGLPPLYVAAAEAQGIPPALFYAIALQESGRAAPETGEMRPWPWSLNLGGKAYYYQDMEAAWDALNDVFLDPPRNIDIGLVQVSWPVNRHVIHDPFMALEPANNLAIGASILRECFDRLGDWWKAVGCYHSPSPKRADAYRRHVERRWQHLVADEEQG